MKIVPPIEPTNPPINFEFLSDVDCAEEFEIAADVGTTTTVVIVVSGETNTEV